MALLLKTTAQVSRYIDPKLGECLVCMTGRAWHPMDHSLPHLTSAGCDRPPAGKGVCMHACKPWSRPLLCSAAAVPIVSRRCAWSQLYPVSHAPAHAKLQTTSTFISLPGLCPAMQPKREYLLYSPTDTAMLFCIAESMWLEIRNTAVYNTPTQPFTQAPHTTHP